MSDKEFWPQDVQTGEAVAENKKSWFKRLSFPRKLLYILLFIFVISWCFFLGHRAFGYVYAQELEEKGVYTVDGTYFNTAEDAYVPVELTGIKTVLLIGCDTREGDVVARSDTIMVAFLNMDTGSVNLLSIPRDSYVRIPGWGSSKINHAFAYGGVTLTQATVEYLLGITIDDYVVIDFQGFREVVDAIGGIEIDVDMDMYNYGENIDLKAGLQTLNGQQALGYVRYRGADCSDYQRIEHQQNFLQALIDKLLSFSTLPKMASIINIAMSNVTTSLTTLSAKDYASYALKMDLQNMNTYTVQGTSMYMLTSGVWISYEIINQSSLTTILNEIAGDGFTFSPNVVTDNGQGRYTLPDDTSVTTDTPSDDGSYYDDEEILDTVDSSDDTQETVDSSETWEDSQE